MGSGSRARLAAIVAGQADLSLAVEGEGADEGEKGEEEEKHSRKSLLMGLLFEGIMRRKVSPRKEFELLYRERDPLPSSTDAYESIIFMKTKKCAPKHTVRQLQQVFSALQHRIAPRHTPDFSLPIPKTNRSAHTSPHAPPHREKLPYSSRYHDSVPSHGSPTNKTELSKWGRQAETSRGKAKTRGKKLEKRKNEDGEYVLLGGSFVKLRKEEVSLLEERLLTSRPAGREGNWEEKSGWVKEESKKDCIYGGAEEIEAQEQHVEARNSWEEEFQEEELEKGINPYEESLKHYLDSSARSQSAETTPNNYPASLAQIASSIQLRHSASTTQKQISLQILNDLHARNCLPTSTFQLKKQQTQTQYQSQLHEIQELKRILEESAGKMHQPLQMELAKKSIGQEKDTFCSYRNRYFKEDVLIMQKDRSAIRHISPEEEEEFYGQKHVQQEDGGFQAMLEDYKLGEEIKEAIDARISWQQGINMERSVKLTEGLESSVGGIHTFLVSFFKFYLDRHNVYFLKLLNMPYGHSIMYRLACLRTKPPSSLINDQQLEEQSQEGIIYGLRNIISNNAFEEYWIRGVREKPSLAFKAHCRAVIDAFNDALNDFRPYRSVNGPPYMWTRSQKALTFYFIEDDNIQQVFEKTQLQILRFASTLCGIIIDLPRIKSPRITSPLFGQYHERVIESYKRGCPRRLFEWRELQLQKMQRQEAVSMAAEWCYLEEWKTQLNLQLSQVLFQAIVDEFMEEMNHINREKS